MNLTNQHKALLLKLQISGTVILSVFNLSLNKQKRLASESYYYIEPEKEIKFLEALEKLNNTKAGTNKTFNETKQNKHFSQAFKPIVPPEDYVPNIKKNFKFCKLL